MSPGNPNHSGWGDGSVTQQSWGYESYGTHQWTTTPLVVPELSTTTTTLIIPEISIVTDYSFGTDCIYSTTTIPPQLLTTTLTTSLSGSTTTYVSTVTRPGTTSLITESVTKTLPPIIKSVTRTLPPIIEETTVTTSLRGSETTLVSTTTRPGSTIIETEEITLTVSGPTIVETEETTLTVSNQVTVTESLIPISTGIVYTAVNPTPTIQGVVTGPACPSPAIENFFGVQWFVYTLPSSDIPPLATHQPYLFPNNETSTSIICNTRVFEKYLRTQLYDCRLGRGPYQTLDCDCNIVVGPIFTGNGPTPTGPGITVTQSGPSGTVLDLGTTISGNYIPVTGAQGQSVCASTTTITLASQLIYTGPITIVPSFYRTVRLGKRAPVSEMTTHAILPGLSDSAGIGPLTHKRANLGVSPNGKTTVAAGSTTTLPIKPWESSATELPVSGSSVTVVAPSSPPTSTKSATTTPIKSSTTQITSPSTNAASSQSPQTQSASSPVTSSSTPGSASLSEPPAQGVHTTNICQLVTYTGDSGFIVPELSIDAENSTMTETAPWTATQAAEASSGTAASSSATVSPATGDAFRMLPSWKLLTALAWLCVNSMLI